MVRLERLNWRGAVVGPHGSGKTTLLDDLSRRLNERGFAIHRLVQTADSAPIPTEVLRDTAARAGARDVILLDGADHLAMWRWWRFRRMTKRAGGLIVATHRRCALPTLVRTRTTPGLLRELMEELAGDRASETELSAAAERLFKRHSGNLREALREMYDVCATT